jgi:molybdopterin converting factor small subunit
MHVMVKLFASLTRFRTGAKVGKPFDVDLPDAANVQDLLALLQIPPEETKIVFINNIIIQEPDKRLCDGDVIGIFPPVGGG